MSEHLVGEAERHHEARVAGCVAQVEQTPFGKNEHRVTVGEDKLVDLWLDVCALHIGHLFEAGHVDLVVEVTNVANDCLMLHAGHVLGRDDVLVARGCDEDVGGLHDIFHAKHFVAFHCSLKRIDWVDLGHDDTAALALERSGASLAHVAITSYNGGLAAEHDVGAAVDAVDEAVADAVEVVELRLGYRIVDVDGWEQKLACITHVVEAVHAGGGLFGDATDAGSDLLPELGALLCCDRAELVHEDMLFFRRIFGCLWDGTSLFELEALVDEHCGVATVVEDEVRAFAVWPVEELFGCPPVLFEGFALPRKDGDAGWGGFGAGRPNSYCGSGVVLGGEDVAGHPANVSTEGGERFDKHRGLDRHVKRSGNACASEWLAVAELGAQCHEAWHFVFGEADFFAAELGQR